jgi:mannose-1-phosphate guanylyltransferase
VLPALLLTAGCGTRLDPLTRLLAKPAVPIAGQPLVERVIGWLVSQGVTDVVLNLHHRPETVAAVVGDGDHLGVRARYSWEQPLLGSAGGPRHALPLLDADPFLVVNGDTLCDFDLAPMIDAHRRHHAGVTMAVVPNPAPDHYNGIALDDDDRIIGFVPKGAAAAGTWHFVGVQITQAAVFAPLADGVPAETVAGLYRELVAARPGWLRGFRATTTFIDVGTPADYLGANRALGDTSANLVWHGATVAPDADVDGCIVAGDTHVPSGFHARGAILMPASVARDGDDAEVRDGIAVFGISAIGAAGAVGAAGLPPSLEASADRRSLGGGG